jgi:2,4-dienoyl-CoA reductase-like NADH-dependent reductase (Old Yellow Enzyme family)/thioredoxin reductase
MTPYPRLFEPLQLGPHTLENRVVLPAHGPRLGGRRYARYLEERLANGVALLIVPGIDVQGLTAVRGGPAFSPTEPDTGFPDPMTDAGARQLDELLLPEIARMAELAHRHGAPCIRQFVHTGTYATRHDMRPGVSASGVPDETLGETPHALTVGEIERFVEGYARAARRARDGGADGIEVHACHGLLLNNFLSPLTNRRTDRYGGSVENRMRFVREILEAIRAEVGADLVVGLRMPVDERVEGGARVEEWATIARGLAPLLTYISVAGASEAGRKGGVTVPAVMSADFPEAVFAEGAGAIRAASGLPVIATGRMTTPEVAERVLEQGQADLVGMVRALIADPAWVAKARAGDRESLRVCTGDNEGCRQRTQFRTRGGGMAIACTVNAAAGREAEFDFAPVAEPRRVLVIGGGPGGMEAARVARLRGHDVVLYEREQRLGGQVRVAARDPRGANLEASVAFLELQLRRLDVDVKLGVELDAAAVSELGADLVVVATGARPAPPRFDAGEMVVSARDVLTGAATVGRRVCVVAGFDGHRGPGTLAELLAERGHEVQLLTERMFVGEAQDPGANHAMQKRLLEQGVTLKPLTGVVAATDGAVTTIHALTRREERIEQVDTVVTVERAAHDELLRALDERGAGNVVAVGDCLAPRRVLHAVLEGARAGMLA